MIIHISLEELEQKAKNLSDFIINENFSLWPLKAYPVPRGGVMAYMLIRQFNQFEIAKTPMEADFFIDDIVGSGTTKRRYQKSYPGKPFYSLIDNEVLTDGNWIVFPWEKTEEAGIEDNFIRILQYIGEDPRRQGLIETPKRVAKAWKHWTKGYSESPAEILKVFEDGAEAYDQMVTVKDIPIYSHCEHHLAPIFGTCTISYIPNGRIVGLSKLSRLAEIFSRRLQVQERMTNQIADALMEHLNPIGVGVHIKARHLCMESRGICQQGHFTLTTALRGEMKNNSQTREEFMSTIK